MSESIGIIAGESTLPILAARQAKCLGMKAVVCGIRSVVMDGVAAEADTYAEFTIGQIGKAIHFFKKNGVSRAVMLGRVPHPAIYRLFAADRKFFSLLRRVRERTTTALLSAVVDFLADEGIIIVDSTFLLQDLLAGEGQLVPGMRMKPELQEEIDFGWEKAWGIARLDIGQTVCVKDRAVVAVEAMEGTDPTIRRARDIAGSGLVVLKVSRPGGEMRFDVPVIGLGTMDILQEVRAKALVMEAGRTLILDKEQVIRRAQSAKILLVGKK